MVNARPREGFLVFFVFYFGHFKSLFRSSLTSKKYTDGDKWGRRGVSRHEGLVQSIVATENKSIQRSVAWLALELQRQQRWLARQYCSRIAVFGYIRHQYTYATTHSFQTTKYQTPLRWSLSGIMTFPCLFAACTFLHRLLRYPRHASLMRVLSMLPAHSQCQCIGLHTLQQRSWWFNKKQNP